MIVQFEEYFLQTEQLKSGPNYYRDSNGNLIPIDFDGTHAPRNSFCAAFVVDFYGLRSYNFIVTYLLGGNSFEFRFFSVT